MRGTIYDIASLMLIALSIYFSPITTIRVLLVGGWLFWTIPLIRIKTVPADAS